MAHTLTMTQKITESAESEPFVIKFKPLTHMDDERFAEFCALNDDLRVERTAKGEIVLMPPTHGDTGNRNADITTDLGIWTRADGTGQILRFVHWILSAQRCPARSRCLMD